MKFSIVVPVYNAENFIDECVNSLLNQDYDDYEVVLVNDGSKDNSLEKCLRFQKQNKKVKVVDKKNGGVGSARNAGIDNAKGEYIIFVDSDDALKENTLSLYEKSLLSNNSDVTISSYVHVKVESNKEITIKNQSNWNGDFSTFMDEKFEYLFDNWLIHCPWNKVYKSDIIKKNNIRFSEEYSIYEDIGFVLDYLYYCKTVSLLTDVLYIYNVKEQGSLVTRFNENAYTAYLDCWIRLKRIISKNKSKYKFFICNMVFAYLKSLYKNKPSKSFERRKELIKMICSDEKFKDLIENLKMKKPHQIIELSLMKRKSVTLINAFLLAMYR